MLTKLFQSYFEYNLKIILKIVKNLLKFKFKLFKN